MKISNEELVKFLIENRTDEYGRVDLSDLDFINRVVLHLGQKAKVIHNSCQKAKEIYNSRQQAIYISNLEQQAKGIDNEDQEANEIYNNNQKIKPKYESMTKDELIARIKELENENKR